MPFADLINNLNETFPKPKEFETKNVAYGTAGFRMKAIHLDWIIYRMGLLANLRSLSQNLKFIGCMITASHNAEEDNGCKLVDPLGDMLEEKWEHFATELVNSNDLKSTLKSLCDNHFKNFIDEYDEKNNDTNSKTHRPNIAVAHDTRASCAHLLNAFKSGVEAFKGSLVNYGLLTTPQLHYMVRCLNTNSSYGEPNEEGYFNKISQAFRNVWSIIDFKADCRFETDLFIDCANGVGADKIKVIGRLITNLPKNSHTECNGHRESHGQLNFHLFNDGKNEGDLLNHHCGADFVKVQQKSPINILISSTNSNKIRKYCSFDGDADRIVYYYLNDNGKTFHLVDGDKICTLTATHLKELVESANLADQINLGIVQTAYANGSSTNFIQNIMKVKASCVPTGVKHLHHEAQNFDIGVYFEANGHGTIIFNQKAEDLIDGKYSELSSKLPSFDDLAELKKFFSENKSLEALYNLKHLKDCINQTVGDAISDLLVVELILASKQMSISDWDSLYTDLPSRQLKVTIKDRTVIKTTDAERRVSEPAELQTQIDNLLVKLGYQTSRAFVRPSGTEDVVRVYAEADTQQNTDDLAKQVARLVYDLAGGVGDRP